MPIIPGVPASGGGQQPDTPTIGLATNRTSTSQNVAFTPSTYTGKVPPITYRAIAFNTSNVEVGRTGTSTTPPIIVTSLSSNTTYKYRVEAFTPTATSGRTGFSNTVTTPPPPPPPPPTPSFSVTPSFTVPPTFSVTPSFTVPPSFSTPPPSFTTKPPTSTTKPPTFTTKPPTFTTVGCNPPCISPYRCLSGRCAI